MRYIPPAELPHVWEAVERGLNRILELCPDYWIPRDVKRHLYQGRCFLYFSDQGFFIVERCNEIFSGSPFLNVWVMYFQPGEGEKLKHQIIEQLDALKAQTFSEWIQFTSPRKAWGRAMDGLFEEYATIWRRK